MFEKFSKNQISLDAMKLIRGGKADWCHTYSCSCGSVSYNGWGTLDDYRADAQSSCSPGNPVSCTFGSLPSGTCGA